MIVNWMLFQNLDCKFAADALGDYAIQGAEIAGADCNYSWPIKEQHWQENGGECSCALWEVLVAVVHAPGISWLGFLLQQGR